MRALWCSIVALGAIACGNGGAPATQAGPTAAQDGAMCAEHGVLESLCTKCNPALIPVFQARGDWCAEHGFAESICPICHPERRGRPARDVSAPAEDEAPADGTKVRLAGAATARHAGIESAPAVAADGPPTIRAPARIVYDATKVAQVNARSAGVVRGISIDIGAQVQAGAALATIESASVGEGQARSRGAAARLEAAEATLARVTALRDEGISSARALVEARQELEAARAERAGALASLRLVGRSGGAAGTYVVTAPIAGTVVRRGTTIGTLVDTDTTLFEIVDTSSMWAEIDIPEDLVRAVAVGSRVTFVIDGLGEAPPLAGAIAYLAPEVDPHTRTVVARVPLANPEGLLRANMFAEARIEARSATQGVWVPRDALQRAKGAHLVFVRMTESLYEARRVDVGLETDDRVEVRGRVAAGDRVVTAGSYLLKTETLRGSIGAGCCAED